MLSAAGYEDLAQAEKFREIENDFWDEKFTPEEIAELKQDSEMLDHITDLKRLFQVDYIHEDLKDNESKTPITPTYNGYHLT